jgi:hypothetical protein
MRTAAFNLCILQPAGYEHSLAFLEAAQNVYYTLTRHGYEVTFRKNRIASDGLNVVFGAHLIGPCQMDVELGANAIVFNTEQMLSDSSFVGEAYRDLLRSHYVWDYSAANATHSDVGTSLFNFTYVPELDRIPKAPSPRFDAVFYGSINDRRREIFAALEARGLRVNLVTGLYGADRDRLIGDARCVLNTHYYESRVLQQIRCFYPLTSGIPVISENFAAEDAPAFYREAILTPGDEAFADYVAGLLGDEAGFRAESERTAAAFRDSLDHASLAQCFDETLSAVDGGRVSRSVPEPRRINLGSGKDYRPGWINIDIDERLLPDHVCDLSRKHAFPLELDGGVSRPRVLEAGSIDMVMANDVLEHVPDLQGLMKTVLDLLREGGEFHITVPYDLSLGAWQDPTHIRGFNENSWLYYTDWAWYLGWSDYCFDRTTLQYHLSDRGMAELSAGKPLEEVIRVPRHVDSMYVVLRKRAMTPEQRQKVLFYRADWLAYP